MKVGETIDFRENYLNGIISVIESESFVREYSSEKAFVRDRKLNFVYLVVLIMQGLQRSIQRELNSFYQKIKGTDFSIQEVTKSAFCHARKKLKWEAFQYLNKVGIDSFYREAPYKTWNGFRVLAIDGSTIRLPNHPSIIEEFGQKNFGPKAETPISLARISMLFDVLNLTTIDAKIEGFESQERILAKDHFPFIEPDKDLVIMDRGYTSIPLMYELIHQKKHFLIRMMDNWWLEVKKMLEAGETDKEVTFTLGRSHRYLMGQYGSDSDEIKCRLVVVTLGDGTKEILCTSVLDKEKLPYDSFEDLYHLRWNIEEAYKLYKSRLQMEDFSGKTALAIKQDFYAKVFIMTTTAVLAFPIEEQLRKEQEEEKKTKHAYKINRTNALSLVKESAPKMFIHRIINTAIASFDNILRATVELIRPNRKNPRKTVRKQPPSSNYKQL